MSQHIWFEHFKEQLQGLNKTFEQSGSSLSLLGYALGEKRISSEEYLNWALTQFKLPKLQSRFFTETPISQEMFAKWATHYRWSEECLPVAEWDGSLIVACLQPPQDFPANPSCVLVLADFENLQNTWKLLHPQKNRPARVEAATEFPEGIDLTQSFATKRIEGAPLSFDDFMGQESPVSETTDEVSDIGVIVAEEPLEGLFNTPATVIQLETISTSVKNTPPPPPADAASTVFEDSFVTQASPVITARPAGIAKPVMNPKGSSHFILEKLKKKLGPLILEKVKKSLSEMKSHFDKSMILTIDDEESQMTAFAWDEKFENLKDTSQRFPLKTPSIFNIVVTTQKSYHGYISLNEINETFFKEWNKGQIPDHVTVTPIIVNEKIIGLLMGFAEKSAYNKDCLALAEKISANFTTGIMAA